MPFLSIFRKDKDIGSPSPSSSSFPRVRSRPSIVSSRVSSPPPQLANISPQSDLSYVLPELEEFQVSIPTSPTKETVKRRLLRRKGGSALATHSPRHTPTSSPSPPRPTSAAVIDRETPRTPTNINRNLHSDSDDQPLVPPPPRASVFAGFSYSEPDHPRAQSVPGESESERPRPLRPQSHHDMGKNKKETGKSGLFGWRSKGPKEVTVEPSESSFSLKSFRHVGPPSPVVMPSESTTSLVPASVSRSTGDDTSTSTARPRPGRSTPATRERINSTGSEGMMAAGLFRQAARRSSTNLAEETAEPIRSRMRDLEKRGPPTRSWGEESGSDRPGPRKSAPDPSSRKTTFDNKPRKSVADAPQSIVDNSPSPFAGRLGESGRTSPFATRSDSGHVPRDYSMYGARSDGGIRNGSKLSRLGTDSSGSQSRVTSPSSPTKPILASQIFASPAQLPSGLPSRPGPQGYTGSRATSPTKPRPSSPEKSRPSSPNKPRVSAPAVTRPTRSPIRSTIPTKTNDGPSLKGMQKRQASGSSQSSAQASRSALGHGRRPSIGDASMRSASVDVLAHSRQPSTDTLSHTRRPSVEVLSHTRRPSGFEVISRPKSPGPTAAAELPRPAHTKTTDQLRQEAIEAMRNGGNNEPSPVERAKSPAPSIASRLTTTRPIPDTEVTPRKNYVPPPRMSSLAAGLMDSDTDESPEEVESESEGLGFGKSAGKAGLGAMRGRHGKDTRPKDARPSMGNGPATRSNSDDQPGLTRERTITQRDAPSKIGVSLFDTPAPRTRASHSMSAISAAATARNSAALAEANNVTVNRPGKKHARGGSFGAGSVSHARMAAGTDTDEDEDEEDESEESSEDDAPLNTLAPAKRPGSAASTAASVRPGPGPRPSAPQTRATAPLISIPGVTSPPPRPPRMNRVPGVGVTRNSSLRGSRSVEDLGRKPVTVRPGPRPFGASPPSSTGDSSSGKAPLTPRDGSEAGRNRSDESRRRERRRSEAKKSVELGNVINGPGPIADDEDDAMSMHHSQMGHTMGMMGMGWQPGFFPPGGVGFPTSQSMPFLHPQLTGPQPMPMGFMPPPPPPGASEVYLQAHHQAMMIAKQTYLSAVAQQAMAAATEQWERSSSIGGSVYGGSQMSVNMGMMGVPMMGMYPGSSYAASAYEGSVAGGWGSASAYGGRSVYGGSGARSEYGGGVKHKPNRPRGKTPTGSSDLRRDPVPPSTWTNRRKGL